nr:6K2 protein [Daphne mosaic virus]
GKDALANFSGVQGRWNGWLITKDLLVVGGVKAGGFWLLYSSFIHRMSERVEYQ